MRARLFNKLSLKLVLITSLVLIILLTIHTFITIQFYKEHLTGIYKDGAVAASDIIKYSMRYSMLLNKRDDIYNSLITISREPGIKKIRIYNKQGKISYSTDTTEIGTIVDKKSESCVACHEGGNVKPTLNTSEGTRFFNINDERVLGLINPIKNEKDCYTSECHAHKSGEQLLGVLDVIMTMKQADHTISQATKNTIVSSFVITLLIAGLSGIFIFFLVSKPLKIFEKGINELGNGNMDYRIYVKGKNEFGKIARQFNEMSKNLSLAYREIKDWSETLNEKVEQKTEELKNVYTQIVQMEKLASLGKLSATVAHELNNPLEGILTYSKLISKKLNSSGNEQYIKLKEYSDLISEESARCGRIVKDMLIFSHTDTSKMELCNITEIVDRSVKLINHYLEMNRIKLEKYFVDNNISGYCNPQKIQQALMSILLNAIEAVSGRDDGRIIILLDRENNSLLIKIKDNGYGISAKDLPHIFEPFYTTKEASKGTGLGLSVVYGIINNHRGKIEVEETSEKGTTFKITIPINQNINDEKQKK